MAKTNLRGLASAHLRLNEIFLDRFGRRTAPTWALFLLCGNPSTCADPAYFTGLNLRLISPVSSPRHIVFDLGGNLWIATTSDASAPQLFRSRTGPRL